MAERNNKQSDKGSTVHIDAETMKNRGVPGIHPQESPGDACTH